MSRYKRYSIKRWHQIPPINKQKTLLIYLRMLKNNGKHLQMIWIIFERSDYPSSYEKSVFPKSSCVSRHSPSEETNNLYNEIQYWLNVCRQLQSQQDRIDLNNLSTNNQLLSRLKVCSLDNEIHLTTFFCPFHSNVKKNWIV